MRTKPLQAYFTIRSGQDERLRRGALEPNRRLGRFRNPGADQEELRSGSGEDQERSSGATQEAREAQEVRSGSGEAQERLRTWSFSRRFKRWGGPCEEASLAPLDRQLAEGAKALALAASRHRCEATQAPQEAVQRSLELALRTVEERRRCDAISPARVAAPASSPVAEPQVVDVATDPRGREHTRCPQIRR